MPPDSFHVDVLHALAVGLTAVTSVDALASTVGSALVPLGGVERVELSLDGPDKHGPQTLSRWSAGGAVRTGRELSVTIEVPATTPGGRKGRLTLTARPGSDQEQALDKGLAQAIASLVALAHRGIHVVTRVASLSREAHRRESQLRRRLGPLATARQQIVAESPLMLAAVRAVELAAPHAAPVLLRGESGTGKELLARHLHETSPRCEGPFVTVNCGAIPAALAESTLFGHEKGAFTGAIKRHSGHFEQASGGTLFLDEVAELPVELQPKLLRVLQEGDLTRVGGTDPIHVDVRIVAATHRPLESLIADGSFREDLYYRLGVFPVEIAPLRERPQDIPPLALAKVEEISKRMGCAVPTLTPEDLHAALSTPWEGNARELGNAIERAFILSAGGHLDLASVCRDLVGGRQRLGHGAAQAAAERATAEQAAIHPLRTFDDSVREVLVNALAATGGKIYGPGGAAERLALKPSTLQAKMSKLGVPRR